MLKYFVKILKCFQQSDFHSLASSSHISFLSPCENKIGLNPIEVDWSINDTDDNQIEPTIDDESISDYVDQPGKEKVSNQIDVDGKLMYKASVIRQGA